MYSVQDPIVARFVVDEHTTCQFGVPDSDDFRPNQKVKIIAINEHGGPQGRPVYFVQCLDDARRVGRAHDAFGNEGLLEKVQGQLYCNNVRMLDSFDANTGTTWNFIMAYKSLGF